MTQNRKRNLGMDQPITRRDFLDGVASTVVVTTVIGAALNPASANRTQANQSAAAYPPAKLGDRGQHPGANQVAHQMRDGTFWSKAGPVEDTREHYDLVVVGGGISGLAAAVLYRQRVGKDARVLVLENHDDFGGHARRNEFQASNGSQLIGYGGSESLQSPSYFSPAVSTLMHDIGLDLEQFKTRYYDTTWSEKRSLHHAWFFSKEKFGTDTLVHRTGKAAEWVPKTPLSARAKIDLIQLIDNPPDYLPELSRVEKLDHLSKKTYQEFLLTVAKVDQQLVDVYQESTVGYFGVGIDATGALDAWGNGNPGFSGMDLGTTPHKSMSPTGRLALTDPDQYIFHFPDGNHGVARALLRALSFEALPATSMEALTTTAVNYQQLDDPKSPARIRLDSTVVKVQHMGSPASAKAVAITYARHGKLAKVTANHVILACWHRVIPYITNELPEVQITALKDQHKVPLIYTNVQIRNWTAFDALKISSISTSGSFWREVKIDFPVSIGNYHFSQNPQDPVILHLSKVPLSTQFGPSPREQADAGRALLQSLSFEKIEWEVRDLLDRTLSSAGFNAARDIEAITVNRWAHGYAYEYMRPWDQFWPDGPLPIETARKGWGRIAIANSDSGAYAYVHSAIDQAVRAVRELVGAAAGAPAFADFPGPPRNKIGLG